MSDPKDVQVGGDHYKRHAIQPIDIMQEYLSDEAYEGFLNGNIIKYALRWKDKGGVEDLRKLQHYVAFLVKHMETKDGSQAKD
jgi:hypothetical protein